MEDSAQPSEFKGSIFQELSRLFLEHGVRAVLVGGYAVNALKVQRMTFDIDFMVTRADFEKIGPELLDMGYSVRNRQDHFIQLKAEKPGLRDLDFLIGDEKTVAELIKAGSPFDIAGRSFIIPSPLHLIAMKLHALAGNADREGKDLYDIVQLMRMYSIDPRKVDIRAMFEKYHAAHLFDKILVMLGVDDEKRR